MDAVSGDPKGKLREDVDGVFVSKGETTGERRRWREIEVPGIGGDGELLEGFADVKPLAVAVAERPRPPAAASGQRELERRFRDNMQAEE